MYACMHVCPGTMCMFNVPGGQKGVSDLLELELQTVATCQVTAGYLSGYSGRTDSVLLLGHLSSPVFLKQNKTISMYLHAWVCVHKILLPSFTETFRHRHKNIGTWSKICRELVSAPGLIPSVHGHCPSLTVA